MLCYGYFILFGAVSQEKLAVRLKGFRNGQQNKHNTSCSAP